MRWASRWRRSASSSTRRRERWVELLRATGLDDDDMWRWHAEFERMAPAAHEEFLVSLGIGEAEIATIRARAAILAAVAMDLPSEEQGGLT